MLKCSYSTGGTGFQFGAGRSDLLMKSSCASFPKLSHWPSRSILSWLTCIQRTISPVSCTLHPTETNLDEIMETEIGEFGWIQWKVYFLLLGPMALTAYSNVGYIFYARDLDYRCRLDGCENGTYSNSWTTAAIPMTTNRLPEHCFHYALLDKESCSFDKSATVACSNDFVFRDPKQTSIVTTFGIYCRENKWMLTLVGTLNNVGQLVGLPITGFLSDKFGRKTTLIWCGVLSSIIGICKTFSPSYVFFSFIEIVEAMVTIGTYYGGFVLGVEVSSPSQRGIASSLAGSWFTVGEIILGVCALFVGDWKILLRILYAPGILLIFYVWLIPESARWLLNNGRPDEAIAFLDNIAKQKGKALSEEAKNKLRNKEHWALNSDKTNKQTLLSSLAEALKSTKIRLRLLNSSFS